MSNFKLSWLKLDVNILDDTKIKILRKYPGGNDLIVLWIGVMCLAMKSDEPGSVEITSGIPYDAESLGYELGIETKTVELGLSLFIKFKMIDIREGGLIEIINFAKHQDLDRIEYTKQKNRERQTKFREKNKSNALLTRESLGSTPIREEEIREDKNRIDEIKEDKNKINIPFDTFWKQYDYKKSSKTKCESKWNKLKDEDRELIIDYIPQYKDSTPDKQYRKHPLTFLNNDGWLEEIIDNKFNNNKKPIENKPKYVDKDYEEMTRGM